MNKEIKKRYIQLRQAYFNPWQKMRKKAELLEKIKKLEKKYPALRYVVV